MDLFSEVCEKFVVGFGLSYLHFFYCNIAVLNVCWWLKCIFSCFFVCFAFKNVFLNIHHALLKGWGNIWNRLNGFYYQMYYDLFLPSFSSHYKWLVQGTFCSSNLFFFAICKQPLFIPLFYYFLLLLWLLLMLLFLLFRNSMTCFLWWSVLR